eukprot:15460570-Alexandrium_andersonii.AAC.1
MPPRRSRSPAPHPGRWVGRSFTCQLCRREGCVGHNPRDLCSMCYPIYMFRMHIRNHAGIWPRRFKYAVTLAVNAMHRT